MRGHPQSIRDWAPEELIKLNLYLSIELMIIGFRNVCIKKKKED